MKNLTRKTQNSLKRNKTNKNTQKNFYSNLTRKIINKLINKFEYTNGTSGIKRDIMKERLNKTNIIQNVNIKSNVTPKGLYVNYEVNGKDIFHFAIHFNINTFYNNIQSPIHFKKSNETKKRKGNKNIYKIPPIIKQIRINSINPLTFTLGTNSNNNMPENWIKEANILLNVLNSYFNKESNYYLFKNFNTNETNNHLLESVLNTMNKASIQSGIYRKDYQTKPSQ